MDWVSLTLGMLLTTLSGVVIWWMLRAESRLRLLQIDLAADRLELRNSLLRVEDSISGLSLASDALLQNNPEQKGVIAVHNVLRRIERQTAAGLSDEVVAAETAKELHSAIRLLLASVNTTGDIKADPMVLKSGTLGLADRLHHLLMAMEIDAGELGLNSLEFARLGELCYRCGHIDWSRRCYEAAVQLTPGHSVSLGSLALLAREQGDVPLQLDWIEKLISQDPDNPELLRSHASLVVQCGEAGEMAERDVLRLEAMGVDTPADQSLLSGLRSRSGTPQEAIARLDKLLEEEPNRGDDWLLKGELHLELGESDQSQKSAGEALRCDRQSGPAWALLAKLTAADDRKRDEALKAATHAVALGAGGTELILLKADLIAAVDGEHQGISSLRNALESDPLDADLRAHLVDLYRQGGDLHHAEQLLASAPLETAPLLVARARIQLVHADQHRDGTGMTDESYISIARCTFEQALEKDRESGITWLGLARCDRLLGHLEAAEESLARAGRLLEGEAAVDAEAAMLALDRGQLSDAGRLIEAAAVNAPGSSLISYLRGNLACHHGEFEVARQHFDDVLDGNDPRHVRARLNRVATLIALGEHDSAMDDCRILLKQSPEMTLASCRLADTLMLIGEWEEARRIWKEVLAKNSEHPHALTQLAGCEMSLGNPELAEAPLNKALTLDPGHTAAWHDRGLLYLEWEQEDAALADFEKAAKSDEKHLDSRLHIASMHHAAERWRQAAMAWREVLDISADNEVARQRLTDCDMALSLASSVE